MRPFALSRRGTAALSTAPLVAIFVLIEWLLLSGRESFAAPLDFAGAIMVPLSIGIFPMLLLAASRRRGEYVPGLIIRGLGHPAVVAAIYLLFVLGIFLHGPVIWQDPAPRLVALLVGTAILGMTALVVRRGSFAPRGVVELCGDRAEGRGVFRITADGAPVAADVWLRYTGGEQHLQVPSGEVTMLADLRSAVFQTAS